MAVLQDFKGRCFELLRVSGISLGPGFRMHAAAFQVSQSPEFCLRGPGSKSEAEKERKRWFCSMEVEILFLTCVSLRISDWGVGGK